MKSYVEHANITVADLDQAIRFFSVALPDFTIRKRGTIDDREWAHIGTDASYVAINTPRDKSQFALPDSRAEYLTTGVYTPRPSLRTISNAMDVGDPSNFARILHLYAEDLGALRTDLTGRRYNDAATRRAIAEVDGEHGYLMDPHTAVGYLALRDVLAGEDVATLGIVLATAHPAKFGDVVEPVIGRKIELPPQLAERLDDPVLSEPLADDDAELKRRLLDWQ